MMMLIGLLLLLLGARSAQVGREEVESLRYLFESTAGEEWRWRTEESAGVAWNFTQDSIGEYVHNPCSTGGAVWQGVTCSANASHCLTNACHIIKLALPSYNLVGSLPPQLGNLTALESLSLYSNALTGTIPHEITNVPDLKMIDLYNNHLTGQFPSVLSNLSALHSLHLSYNMFTGPLPPELGNLQNIGILYLDNNDFTGVIPSEIGYLFVVEELDLSGNDLTGSIISVLGNLTTLQVLYLESNELTGSIPMEIGDLSVLRKLVVEFNQLGKEIPSELGRLSALEHLDFGFNQLTGKIPTEICDLMALTRLSIDENSLTGSIPTEIGKLSSLMLLVLDHNYLTNTIPVELGNLTDIYWLDLNSNMLTGEIPLQVGKLSSLETILLDYNELGGAIPPELCNCTKLLWVGLQSNDFSGTIPSELGNLRYLEFLVLLYNEITGTIPPEIGKLSVLEVIDFGFNKLTGIIPPELGSLNALYWLDIESNALSGNIPFQIGQLSALYWLKLDFNDISGSIPSELGDLMSLEILELSANSLTGVIPPQMGNISALFWLALYRNKLTGTIPSSMSKLTALENLSLDYNMLSGSIPSILGCNSALVGINLEQNQLTASIPPELGSLRDLRNLYLDNNFLTGKIPSELGHLDQLEVVDFDTNELTGPIPREFGSLSLLNSLDMSLNQLSSTIPSELSNLSSLYRIYLSSNKLTGLIPPELGQLSTLQVLDMGSNLLTGLIPPELGNLNVVVIALSVNCLENTIPDSFCDLKNVGVLSLNGLEGADGCKTTITVPLFGTTLQRNRESDIPSCLWNLDNLTTLHLAGNGLVGDVYIDSSTVSGSQLNDVSLSHNRLTGSIPTFIQSMKVVDLSHNRFTGHLSDVTNTTNETTLHTQVNRLSGRLPTRILQTIPNLNILHGNMFSCATIPENDVNRHGYICGSQLYNFSLYLMVSVLFALCCLFAIIHMSSHVKLKLTDGLVGNGNILLHYSGATGIPDLTAKFSCHIKFLCFLVPVFIVASVPAFILRMADDDHSHSSHWNTYSWALSFTYMNGTLMGILMLVVWTMGAAAFFTYVVYGLRHINDNSMTTVTNSNSGTTTAADDDTSPNWNVQVFVASLCSLCVTLLVNVLYILSITELTLSPAASFTIRFAVSLFRIFSSAVLIPFISSPITDAVKKTIFMFRLLMLNNTIIPCIVTALTSSNCFQELLVEPGAIHTVYSYSECSKVVVFVDGTRICEGYQEAMRETSPFVPGFIYNYQCTSVLLEAYIPVLIIGFCLQLLLPLVLICTISDKLFAATPKFFRVQLNGILWPEFWYNNADNDLIEPQNLMKMPNILYRDILNPVAVIMTFGLCSPPLACMAAAVGAMKCCLWIWAMNRFDKVMHEKCAERSHKRILLSALLKLEFPLQTVMRKTFSLILGCSAFLIIFLYWDTKGEFGWEAPLEVGVLTLLFWCLSHIEKKTRAKSLTKSAAKIEVRTLSTNPIVEQY